MCFRLYLVIDIHRSRPMGISVPTNSFLIHLCVSDSIAITVAKKSLLQELFSNYLIISDVQRPFEGRFLCGH